MADLRYRFVVGRKRAIMGDEAENEADDIIACNLPSAANYHNLGVALLDF